MKAPIFLGALALAACTSIQPLMAGPSAGFRQWASVGGLKVRPVSVIEDSRCPADVQCVWAGRIVVRSEVIGGDWRRTLDLELGKPQPVADGALTLIVVEPAKLVRAPTDRRTYRFTYDFQGGL